MTLNQVSWSKVKAKDLYFKKNAFIVMIVMCNVLNLRVPFKYQ